MRKDLVIDKPVRDYLVTETGQVVVNHGKNKGRILSVYESNNGYAKCTLRKIDGTSYPVLMHRLMAETFIPNPLGLPHVNHKDSNRMNYQVDNLEWCTASENIQHGKDFGNIPQGHECTFSSLTEDQVLSVYGMLLEGQRVIDVSRATGIHRAIVTNIKSRKSYSYTTKDLPDIEIRGQNKPLSKETVLWVANRFSEGLSNYEVVALSNNPLITHSMLSRIRRRKCFASLTSEFKW